MSEPDEVCDHCPHPFGGHAVVATTGDPKAGGIILCNIKDCTCFSTWSVPQLGSTADSVHVPSMQEVEQLRLEIQTASP